MTRADESHHPSKRREGLPESKVLIRGIGLVALQEYQNRSGLQGVRAQGLGWE